VRVETHNLSLTERERFTLHALLDDSSIRARRRARMVLDWAEGQDYKIIARTLQTRVPRVQRVTAAFLEKRLDIFSAAARKRVLISPQRERPRERFHLTAQTSMGEAARQILDHQFSKLRRFEQAVHTSEDVEAVHDMRVACRRINSALRLFKNYLPAKRVKKLRAVLEQLRDLLGAARNLDVLSADLETHRALVVEQENAPLQSLAEAWRGERATQQNALVERLDSADYRVWCERMDAFLAENENDSSPRVADVLPALLWKQYGAVRVYETRLAGATLEELHALRIDIKRLRYTLEFFSDAFDEKPAALIEPLIALQDQLGLIQDAVVAGHALTDFIAAQARAAQRAGKALADFQAVAAYHAHLQRRIAELRLELPEQWAMVVAQTFREQLAQLTAQL